MKKKVRKKLIRVLSLICLILVVVVIILGISVFKKNENINPINKLVGEWTTDGVTVYKFNDDNTGVLILPLGEYKFDYEMDDSNLSIDFVDKKSNDSKYTYSFKDGKLILKGSNGEFVFKKK